MAGRGYVDDFTEIRLDAQPSLPKQILSASDIWTSSSASVLADSRHNGGLWQLDEGWQGLDMPEVSVSHTPISDGVGGSLTQLAFLPRTITVPAAGLNYDKAQLQKLFALCAKRTRLMFGFKHDPLADSSYVFLANYTGGINRPKRGHNPVSKIRPSFTSDFPHIVKPEVSAVGATSAFTTSGGDDICWGVYFENITSNILGVTVLEGSTAIGTLQFGLSGRATRYLVIPGGPFKSFAAYDANDVRVPSITRISKTGNLPTYLKPDTAYTANLTGGTGKIFWLENLTGA